MHCALGLLTLLVAAGPPVVEVRTHNGAPKIVINGTVHSGMSYMTYRPDGENFRKIGRTGVHLYSFSATPTESTYGLAPICWKNRETFDYAHMDERAHMVLDNDPAAYFFPRIYLGTPPWWAEEYPDDLVRFDPGDGTSQVFVLKDKKIASWASEQWRIDTAEAIRRFIDHVEQSDHADRCIGYHIASGTTEEWMQWGSNEDQWADYSPVNLTRFRAWLQERYRTDDALQGAWHNPGVTFATAAIPPRSERKVGEMHYLRDPATAQPAIDYVLYTSWLVADTMKYFAAVTKEKTSGNRLVGVFYGYVLQLAGQQREQNSGHLALRDVFACADIDFVTSPSSYAFRELGTGCPHAMSLIDTVRHHGKLWIDENDYRTWLTPGIDVGQWGKTATFEESLLCQQRELAWVLTNGLGMWWFDMGGGWYDDPRMLAEIGAMNRIAESCIDADVRSISEIAFVVDPGSAAYMKPSNPWTWEALVKQQPELARTGAPFASISLDDLDELPKYRLYIFPNCLAPSPRERASLRAKVRTKGAAVVWLGPSGLTHEGELNEAAMRDLTGLPLALQECDKELIIAPTPEAKPWGWDAEEPFGTGSVSGIVATLDMGDATVLATISGTDLPAVVTAEMGGALTVASSVPVLPTSLWHAIAKRAGVHLYLDAGDICWVCRDLLAVSVEDAGTRRVRLPERRRVVDLWTGQEVAKDADSFDVDIAKNATALFRLR